MAEAAPYLLFGSQGSGSASTEMALRACQLPYRVVRASTWEDDSEREQLARHNPLGQIPTLVLPDGSVLTESAAILIHLGLVHPASGLLPADAAVRAQVIRGLVFIAANCYSAIGIIDYPQRWTSATTKAAQDKVRQGARARLHHHWEVFADQAAQLVDGGGFLGGAAPGALDMLAVVVSRWSGARAHLKKHRPACHAVLERAEAHARLAPVMREHWPA